MIDIPVWILTVWLWQPFEQRNLIYFRPSECEEVLDELKEKNEIRTPYGYCTAGRLDLK